jgi:uncharacterized phage protein (TIGR01671 family)
MKELRFRVWHLPEKRMYYRGYQKLLYVLLCEDDHGTNDGKGRPVKRARYDDCEMLEGSSVLDKNRVEIYEGDIVQISYKGKIFKDVVDSIADMFGSKKIHPFQNLLLRHGISGNPENLNIEILGNIYEAPELGL